MDYNRLHTFIKVAEALSVSKAARLLHRTQSAITQQVRGLEDELGFELFERRQARLFLSPQGELLLRAAQSGLGVIDDAAAGIQDNARRLRGRIRVAALADDSTEFDPAQLICAFRLAHPEVDFELIQGSNERVEAMLRAGDVEFGLSIIFSDREAFERREIAVAAHTLVMSKAYAAKVNHKVHRYRDVLDAALIDFSDGFLCMTPWFAKNKPELVSELQRRRPNLVFADHRASRLAVLAGLGMAIMPQHMIAKELASGAIVPVIPTSRDLRVGLDIAHRKGRPLRLVERRFWDEAVLQAPG